jgi:hypothetical protein
MPETSGEARERTLMENEAFNRRVAVGDVWDRVIPHHFPGVVDEALEVLMERTSDNTRARALVLTPSYLWQVDMSRPSSQDDFKIVARCEPLIAMSMCQEIEVDEPGTMGAISGFKITLDAPQSQWSVTIPLEGERLGDSGRRRVKAFADAVLKRVTDRAKR